MKVWARWNQRTGQLAPLGDLIGYPPYIYETQGEAFKAIANASCIGEELAVEVEIKVPATGFAQVNGLPVKLRKPRKACSEKQT